MGPAQKKEWTLMRIRKNLLALFVYLIQDIPDTVTILTKQFLLRGIFYLFIYD